MFVNDPIHGFIELNELQGALLELPELQRLQWIRQLGLSFLTDAIKEPGPMLIDLRPLREVLSSTKFLQALNNPEAVKIVFAFDALVIWNGSTAAQSLVSV